MSRTTAPSYDRKGLLGVGIPDGIEESVQEVCGERGATVINIAAGYQTRQAGSAVAGAEVGQAFAVGVDTAAGATGREPTGLAPCPQCGQGGATAQG